jgi:hypothetical protein
MAHDDTAQQQANADLFDEIDSVIADIRLALTELRGDVKNTEDDDGRP